MKQELNIYVDGSHLDKQNNGRLGVGGILVKPSSGSLGKSLETFAHELTSEYMRSEYGALKCSNPSAELVAVLFALREFKGIFKNIEKIKIHADYIGVREWCNGAWKIKEPYIKKIKEAIDKEIKQQGLLGKIEYVWVRGHQKNNNEPETYWNNQADLLAKGE